MVAKDPVARYERHKDVYDRIANKVEETHERFLEADRPTQRMVLNQAVSFALISAQTGVEQHERGYVGLITEAGMTDQTAVTSVLRDKGVNYCNNKAKYIVHNTTEADADRVIDHIEAEEYNQALRATVDEFKGVAMAKGAYALAKIGVPKMACIDTWISKFLGMDQEDVYSGVVPEKYMAQISQLDDIELAEHLDSRFMRQWVCFDTMRETVTTHDVWFESLPFDTGPV